MKNIKNIKTWALGLMIPFVISCSDDDPTMSTISEFEPWTPTMSSETPAVTTGEADSEVLTFDFALDQRQITSVHLTVSAGPSSTAIEGVDFEILTTDFEFDALEGESGFQVSIQILGDYDNESEDETIYLTFSSDLPSGVDNSEVLVATIVDTPICEYDITQMVGALSGIDITIGDSPYDSEVIISESAGEFQITGLGVGWMTDFWGEVIETMEEVDLMVDGENDYVFFLTIPSQSYMTTTYLGAPQDTYLIEGTGVLTKCTNTLVIEYALINNDTDWAAWTYDNGYMSEEKFTATLQVP